MPEYLAPAVYVEETSFRSKSIDGVGTSTAAFVGETLRGPVGVSPPLLTSFSDFEQYYGGVDDLGPNRVNYLAHAAFAFFNNGGGRLYIARILGANATAGSVELTAAAPAGKQVMLFSRAAGGASCSVRLVQVSLATTKRLALRQPLGTLVQLGTGFYVIGTSPMATSVAGNDASAFTDAGENDAVSIFTLSVEISDASGIIAKYSGLGFDVLHPRFAGLVLGATPPIASDALTNPIRLQVDQGVTPFVLQAATASRTVTLTGSVGDGPPTGDSFGDALNRLLAVEAISIVAAPGSSAYTEPLPAAVNRLLIGHAESRRSYRIAILDTPPNLEPGDVRALKSLIDSSYAALYYPWIVVTNPLAGSDPTEPSQVALPPSGFVAGIYARSDIQRGVFKAPANETVTGALGLQRDVRFGEQEVLNPLGINCIRVLPNRGIRVWGGRTLSSDPEWKYVNIRRYFLYLESSIDRGTQWAVFEPNGERLWANVRTTVSDFLYNEWLNGALLGATGKEGFFVRCDRTTMSQNDLDNGRLICLVGVAAIKPAEFVIFRIGQTTADARS